MWPESSPKKPKLQSNTSKEDDEAARVIGLLVEDVEEEFKMEYPNFENLRHFRPTQTRDRWVEPKKMDRMLLQKIDDFRAFTGFPIAVTSAYRPGDDGQHGLGLAVDLMSPSWMEHGRNLMDFYFAAERFNFHGIGIYRDWYYDGKKYGGIHVDERDLGLDKHGENDFQGARWICIKEYDEKAGKDIQIYKTMNLENLRHYKFL